MWKGKAFTRLAAGLFVVAAAACAGGDEAADTAGGDAAAPEATPPSTTTPATPAPGGDPTTAPAAGGTAAAPAAGGDNAALVAQGQQIWSSSVCVSCHGPNAEGTPLAPALNDNEWLWVEPGADMQAQVATIIKEGVPQPKDPAHVAPMLPYGGVPLDDAQVDALAAYVVSLNQ